MKMMDVEVELNLVNCNLKTLKEFFQEEKRKRDSVVKLCSSYESKYAHISASVKEKHVVDGNCLERDSFGPAFVPKDVIDIQLEKPIHFIACKSTANGDCLYNPASCLLAGDKSLCSYFRLVTALELALDVEYYVQHPRIEKTLKSENNVSSKATLFFFPHLG